MNRAVPAFALTLVLLALAATAGANGVHPVLRFSVDSGDNWLVTVSDNGPGDSNPVLGLISYNGPVGGSWAVNVTTGQSVPSSGTPIMPNLGLNSVNVFSQVDDGQPLTIQFSDQNFGPLPAGYRFMTSVGGVFSEADGDFVGEGTTAAVNGDGGISFFTFGNASNTLFADNSGIAATNLGPFGPGAFSGLEYSATGGPIAAPYSLTLQSTIMTSIPGTISSFDMHLTAVNAVPEPLTMGAVFLGVASLAGYVRKRRKA